ncbi:MAG TPA: Asp-tRNA(Asn)/Glu-tRNA(Gln) amidotransferase subunit GatB [Candidatus Dormibacteraeota bacterium]|nr:Asp-tRNA(Asn)/Glu-tRNA(Gln) amidotransferase subunit GatB [Candidatus Dormibacteraeota bacterium]
MSRSDWEVVIGMEVHAQARTLSKMFCGCSIAELNDPPNTHVCEVCLGLPGVLPVINRAAVEACLKTALALSCEIPRHTKWDRKNYMYPDLPKGYQISQYDLPMSVNGYLVVGQRRVRIRRVHLEEDTGKLVHAGDKLHKAWESYVDLNRAGVPLMEIVSEPDLRSADEARDYAAELQAVLRVVGASSAEMEKGQMRAEPNVSVRPAGSQELGVKTELKNINSFRALQRAIGFEVERQIQVLESGGAVVQETRGWSEQEQRTFSQRSKEFAEDYRYFPEPDLPPLELDRAWIDGLRAILPELPSVTRESLKKELPEKVAVLIGGSRDMSDLYRRTVALGAPSTSTASWIVNEVAPTGKLPSPENLAELVNLVADGNITRDQGREVLIESVETGRTPAEIVAEHGYAQVSDESELKVIAEAVIDANPKAAADYRGGKKQAMQALMADLRKRAPQANPKVANQLLLKLLG